MDLTPQGNTCNVHVRLLLVISIPTPAIHLEHGSTLLPLLPRVHVHLTGIHQTGVLTFMGKLTDPIVLQH